MGSPIIYFFPGLLLGMIYFQKLYFPRSRDYDPKDKDLGGQDFVLYAFVTDATDDVTAGSDGVEHM